MIKTNLFSWILILVGLIFVAKNIFGLNILADIKWNYIWPILLIVWGISNMIKK